MSVPVRAVLVDERPSVADLLVDALGRDGFSPSIERVASRDAYVRALANGGADVVLANLSTPGLDAFDALALLRDADGEVPFLVVSDRLDEGSALRAIRAGARDCIPHAALSRLGPVLERSLADARV